MSWGLASFTLLGILLLTSSGHIFIGDNGVGHKNAFGAFWLDWDKIRRIEFGTYGTLVLHGGDNQRFVLQPPHHWSGPHKDAARRLLETKLQALGLPALFSRTAE